MTDSRVDMSPEAIARRLDAMAQLYRLGVSLRAAGRHPSAPALSGTRAEPMESRTREDAAETRPEAAASRGS